MSGAVNESGAFHQRSILLRKGFLGGLAMATPFYAEFFSWRWVVLLVVPLFVLLLVRRENVKKPPLAILPMVLLLLLHVVALGFSHTPFAKQVVKDLVIASFLLFVYVLADEDMLAGFFSVLIPLALVTALLGLLKAGLLDRGYMLGFILDGCDRYPAGSALCVNYNNLGLLWLVAALGCMKTRFWWLIPIFVAAGALSSSRRFIILVVFLPVVWITLRGYLSIIRIVPVVLLSIFIVNSISDPESFEKFRFGDEPFTVFRLENFIGDSQNQNQNQNQKQNQTINRSTPEAMLGTMLDGSGGTASRLDLWRLGISMVSLVPQGWRYHQIFSCEFSGCKYFDYPHFSIFSEWIIGGVFFALVAIAFFVWPFWLILKTRRLFPIALFFLAMPYVLISGDTVFSLPICIGCMLVAFSVVERPLRQ